jgi:hypothetical protein
MADSTSSTDPRGWLSACPELNQFVSDSAVAAAVAAGDARRLRAALEKRRKGSRGAFEGRAIGAILARRRLFTMPVTKAPTLSTVNGIGARIYGKSDVAPDGTYVGTLFFTVLYLPLWPIAQYLLWSQGNQYQFFGEVPLSPTMRTWRRVFGVLLVAGVAAIGLAIWQGGSHAPVYLVNGLDQPVAVEAGGKTTKVAPGGRATVDLRTGPQRIRTTMGDRVVEELQVEVPRWTDVVAYNPLGAAALFAEGVVYVADGKPQPKSAPPVVLLAGTPFVVRDHVEFPFREAPQKLQIEGKANTVTKWRVDVVPGGWRAALEALSWEGKLDTAAALAGRLAKASAADRAEIRVRQIVLTSWASGPEAALPIAREAAAEAPDEVSIQKVLSHFLVVTGRLEEARAIFRERAARQPDSALAAYLRARLEPEPVARQLFGDLVRRFPKDPNARRGLGWAERVAGKPLEAVKQWDEMDRLAPDGAGDTVELVAEALVSAGRAAEALERIDRAVAAGPSLDNVVLRAQVARIAGAPDPRRALHALVAGTKAEPADPRISAIARARAAAILGDPPPDAKALDDVLDPRVRAQVQILAAAGTDPARALQDAAKAQPNALAMLPHGVAALLAGEAARRGDAALAFRISQPSHAFAAPAPAIAAYVRGETPPELDDLAGESRAALLLARARAAQAAGKDASALYAAARAADPLRGAVTLAIERWPKP